MKDSSYSMIFQEKDTPHAKDVMNFKENISSLKKMNIKVKDIEKPFTPMSKSELQKTIEDKNIFFISLMDFAIRQNPEILKDILRNIDNQRQAMLAMLDTDSGKFLDKKDRDLIAQLAEDILTEEKAIQMGYVPSKNAVEKLIFERELICESLSQKVYPYVHQLDLLMQKQQKKEKEVNL